MGKCTLLQDFKAFAMKGNVVDMAVGVIIGGAFGKIVTSVVNDIIMPPIGLFVGGMDFKDLKYVMQEAVPEKLNEAGEVIEAAVPEVTLNYGNFLQQTFDFIIIAFAVFCMVKAINGLHAKAEELAKKEEEEAAVEEPAPEVSAAPPAHGKAMPASAPAVWNICFPL